MKKRFLVLTVIILFSQVGLAWGPQGHQITALIAQQILKNQSQQKDHEAMTALKVINTILGQTTIDEAAVWPDKIKDISTSCDKANTPFVMSNGKRSEVCNAYAATAKWHFSTINADKGQSRYEYPATTSINGKPSPYSIGDVVLILKGLSHVLRNENASILEEVGSYAIWKKICLSLPNHNCKKEALEFVIHFMGDIHQPLHSGAACDGGGNSQYITFFGASEDPMAEGWCHGKGAPCTNHELHQAWDTTLLVMNDLSTDKKGVPSSFASTYAQKILDSMAQKQQGSTLKNGSEVCMKSAPVLSLSENNMDDNSRTPNNGPVTWVNESACYFPQIYTFPDPQPTPQSHPLPPNPLLNNAKNGKRIQRNVAQAAVPPPPNLCRPNTSGDGGKYQSFEVGQKYYNDNITVIYERLYWGGARLANLLKYIYGQGDKVQNDLQ